MSRKLLFMKLQIDALRVFQHLPCWRFWSRTLAFLPAGFEKPGCMGFWSCVAAWWGLLPGRFTGFQKLLLKIHTCAKVLPDFLPILTVFGLECQIYMTFMEKYEQFSSHKWKFLAITLEKAAMKAGRHWKTGILC